MDGTFEIEQINGDSPITVGKPTVLGDPQGSDTKALLDSEITVLRAEYSNTPGNNWQQSTGSVRDLVYGILSAHPVAEQKDGPALVFAKSLVSKTVQISGKKVTYGQRYQVAIESITAIVGDIDGTFKARALADRIYELGYCGVVYTTPSHDKKKTEFGDRFRFIIFLQEPIVFPDPIKFKKDKKTGRISDARRNAVAEYHSRYAGLCELLGLDEIDPSAMDLNHMQYTPRRLSADAEFEHYFIAGKPLRYEDMPKGDPSKYRKHKPTPSGHSLSEKTNATNVVLSDGFNMLPWWNDGGRYLDGELFFDTIGWDVRGAASGGWTEIQCPNSAQHSNPEDDTAGYAVSEDGFAINCFHSHCRGQGLRTLQYLLLVERAIIEGEVHLPDEYGSMSELLCDPCLYPDEVDGVETVFDRAKYISSTTKSDDSNSAQTPKLLSDPLWADGLVEDGWCKKKKVSTIKRQIASELRGRVSHVILEGGKSKVFVHSQPGRLPEVWDDTALDKYFRNRRVMYKVHGAKKSGIINPAQVFIEDGLRVTFTGTQFEPDPEKVDPNKYNTFNGFPLVPASAGNWSLLRNHLRDNLIAGNGASDSDDERLFNYFMTWCADIFQNAGRKKGSSIAILGEQGVGKSKFFDWLREGLGDYAVKVASKKNLVGNFNGHLDSKLLVVAEEAFWSGDKEAASVLKDFITSDTYMVERKGVDQVERRNLIRTAFVTNNDWAIPTDDNADARRFLVLRAGNAQKQNGEHFAAIDEQMRQGGLEAMVHEFMSWDPARVGLSFDDLRSAPWTAARAEQASYSANAPKSALLQIIEDGVFTDPNGTEIDLNDAEPTRVRRTDLTYAIQGKATHGGARKSVKKAIEQVLGDDAWHDNKHAFSDGKKYRYVEFPALNALRERIMRITDEWGVSSPANSSRVHLTVLAGRREKTWSPKIESRGRLERLRASPSVTRLCFRSSNGWKVSLRQDAQVSLPCVEPWQLLKVGLAKYVTKPKV